MKLIYRGTTYNYDPDRVKTSRTFPRTDRSAYKLIYRGTTYQVHRNQAGAVTAIIDSTNLFKRKSLTTHSETPKLAGKHSESRSR